MNIGGLVSLDRVKNSGVWVLVGLVAAPLALSSTLDSLAKFGLFHPPPVETEPRSMDTKSRDQFIELVQTSKRHEELLGKLVGAQEDVSSAVKSNAITTGVLATAIKEGFERIERQIMNHDNQTRGRP